jgi:tellurite resistance protein
VGPLVLGRLLSGPPPPAAQVPTLAILLAPPAIAGNAYFALNGARADALAYALAGCALLMALVQLRLLPLYRAAAFAPSAWAYTFPCAALVSLAHRWLAIRSPAGGPAMAWALLMLLTGLVAAVAWRSLDALRRGAFAP